MKKERYGFAYSILIRYALILAAGLGNLLFFYSIFTFPTVKTTYFLLSLVSETISFDNIIIFNNYAIYIVEACIAGAAYYLLFILILSTADISFARRAYLAIFSFSLFFVFNVFRIFFLIIITGTVYFDYFHLFLWYAISTIFVVFIWLLCIKIFKLESVPVYSDLKEILKLYKTKK
jgi:exosortase/archaeosortase family protein